MKILSFFSILLAIIGFKQSVYLILKKNFESLLRQFTVTEKLH